MKPHARRGYNPTNACVKFSSICMITTSNSFLMCLVGKSGPKFPEVAEKKFKACFNRHVKTILTTHFWPVDCIGLDQVWHCVRLYRLSVLYMNIHFG